MAVGNTAGSALRRLVSLTTPHRLLRLRRPRTLVGWFWGSPWVKKPGDWDPSHHLGYGYCERRQAISGQDDAIFIMALQCPLKLAAEPLDTINEQPIPECVAWSALDWQSSDINLIRRPPRTPYGVEDPL